MSQYYDFLFSPTLDEIDRLNAHGTTDSNIEELHEKFLKTFEEVG